jgi:SAM-dependent methyltransferase
MKTKTITLKLPPEGSLMPSSSVDPIEYYYKPLFGHLYVARINTVLGLLSPRRYARILEIGYGSGVLLPTLVPYAEQYVCADIEPPMPSLVSNMQRLGVDTGKIEFLQGDIRTLEFMPVDLVVAISIFEHVHDLDDLLEALREKIRPGGMLLVGMPRVDRIMTWLIEHGLRFKGIDEHHVSTFPMFMKYSKKYFSLLKTARLPAYAPQFGALYHAALLQSK